MYRPRLLEPAHAVLLLQALYGSFFDDGLAVGNAVELGLVGVSLYREGVLPPDEFFKGQLPHLIEQLRKGLRLEFSQ